jgi:DNA-directed RNA polymerase subunit K/omega
VPLRIETSSLALARELWRYGEPALAKKARALRPPKVLQLAERAGEIQMSGESDRLWPEGPRADKALLLAATELLEGKARPTQLTRRLPEKKLPPDFQATEEDLWDAANEIAMEELKETLRRQKAHR